jgi:hypothetical protein
MFAEFSSNEDARCCGSGTCIIDPQGRCWCGQQWDGHKMSHIRAADDSSPAPSAAEPPADPNARGIA